MPYLTASGDSYERAGRLSHSAAAVQAMADKADFFVPADTLQNAEWVRDVVVDKAALSASAASVKLESAIAIDGSHLVQPVRDGMPSVMYGYAQAAAAAVDLDVMSEQDRAPFIDPVEMERAVSSALVAIDLPVAGAYARHGITIQESWRELVNRIFQEKFVEVDGFKHSLLELLFRLHGSPEQAADHVPVNCPSCDVTEIKVGSSSGRCPGCGLTLYPTDNLRIHEGVQEDASNEASLGRLRSVIELLVLVGLTTLMWERSREALLPKTLFIQDGPLAMYGEPAKLRAQAERYFREMTKSSPAGAPYICGIEKSGVFVDYGRALARHNLVLPGEVVVCGLPILERLVSTADPIAYGKETYWGRKFIYRSIDGRVVVITVPPQLGSAYDAQGGQPGPDGYPTLPAILDVIDRTGSSMYQDGVIPVAAAHGRAAFPIGVGSDVLRLVAHEKLGLKK